MKYKRVKNNPEDEWSPHFVYLILKLTLVKMHKIRYPTLKDEVL